MKRILVKLRKYNKNKYRQFTFCLIVSITLVSSFASLILSNMIKAALPSGGDSQMQAGILFIIDLIGCFLLIWYAENLFIKSKSKELGIFLALGTGRGKLKKYLVKDIMPILLKCSLVGLLLGNALTFIIWNLFRTIFGREEFERYQFSVTGVAVGSVFCVFVIIFVNMIIKRYVKKLFVLDLLYAENKNETISCTIAKRTLIVGIIFIVTGIFLGYAVPLISSFLFHKGLPGVWKATYLLAIAGIYKVLVYCISFHEKGRNLENYYKNIIAYSMMRFQGRQNVKSMCVIALLLFGGLFAVYYPLDLVTAGLSAENKSADFSIPFRTEDDIFDKEEIEALAYKYDVGITDYRESHFANLLTGMIERDLNEKKELVSELVEKDKYCDFINVNQYNEVFGSRLSLEPGWYYTIVMSDSGESYFQNSDDLRYVYDAHGNRKEVAFKGEVENDDLLGAGLGDAKYILSEADYQSVAVDLSPENMISSIIFNMDDEGKQHDFSLEIYRTILSRTSEDAAVNSEYDRYQEEKARQKGEEYFNSEKLEMSVDNADLMNDWKYYPLITEIYSSALFQYAAVLLFLFSYIAIICLIAVMVILYTRAMTLGINNRHIYLDLYKLGASEEYVESCVRGQLKSLFAVTTGIGCLTSVLLKGSFFWGNDLYISQTEISTFFFMILTILCVFGLMYVVYKVTVKNLMAVINERRNK